MMILLPIISSTVLAKFYLKERVITLAVNSKLNEYIISQSSPTDYIINNPYVGGIRFYATGYYWFGYYMVSRIHQQLFPRREFPKLNLVVKARKPKVVVKNAVLIKCLSKDNTSLDSCYPDEKLKEESLSNDYIDMGFIYVKE